MSLIVLYLSIRCDVCEWNSLQAITLISVFVTFDLHLWPSAYMSRALSLKSLYVPYVVVHWYQKWSLLVQYNLKYGKSNAENLNDVIVVTSSPIRILWNSNTNLPRTYQSDKLNFSLIGRWELRSIKEK